MTTAEAIEHRHSIRKYTDKPITGAVRDNLSAFIDSVSVESGLEFRLCLDEPKAFDSLLAHYGRFSGVRNYIAISGPAGKDEAVGYYGEKIVLYAETLGLNTCWVALTYSKANASFARSDSVKPYLVIALGYGADRQLYYVQQESESASE